MMRLVKGIMLLTVCAAVAGLTMCAKNPVEDTAGGDAEVYHASNSVSVLDAVVFGDGYGRPVSVRIHFYADDDGIDWPDSVSLTWPRLDGGQTVVSRYITLGDDNTFDVNFQPFDSYYPTGYTDIPGGGRGLVTVYRNGEGDNFFNVLDGIGPIIADWEDMIAGMSGPILIENPYPGVVPDTLIIQVSESIGDGALEGGGSIVYSQSSSRPALTDPGTPLYVSEAYLDINGANGYRLVLAPGSRMRPEGGSWIRFNPGSYIRDAAGNGVQPDNRWVQLREIEVPPIIESAWYTSDPMTGLRDYVYVTFNKPVDIHWLFRGYFKFDTYTNKISMDGSYISHIDEKTIRIDLRLAGLRQTAIATSGSVTVTVGFYEWEEPMPRIAIDRAKPVLVETVSVKMGATGANGNSAPDTITVVYSEQLSAAAKQITQPIVIYSRTGALIQTPTLQLASESVVSGTSYYRVTYSVVGELSNAIKSGDSVNINMSAGVSDRETPPNYQDVGNRKVPLEVKYQLGSVNWSVRVKNNPFKSGSSTTVEISPVAKGATFVVYATIRLYDDLGNLVKDTSIADQPNAIEWKWDGYNRRGSMVATGTYLLKADCWANDVLVSDMTVPRKSVTQAIGFVR